MEYGIKFRPIKPGSPHLNGKVERSQKTDLEEFYAIVDLSSKGLAEQLFDWQCQYNEFPPHGSLGNKTPWERWSELLFQTPYCDEATAMYDPSKERLRHQNYKIDLELARLFETRRASQAARL
jgi:hypothetical protein